MNKVNPSARRKARRFALQGMYQWQMTGTPVKDIEKQFLEENDMHKVDMDFFREIMAGVAKEVEGLDENIELFLDRKIGELDPVTLANLRISTFELKERIDIPYKIVINEGVELAKVFGSEDSHRFVNGVLDKLAKKLRSTEFDSQA